MIGLTPTNVCDPVFFDTKGVTEIYHSDSYWVKSVMQGYCPQHQWDIPSCFSPNILSMLKSKSDKDRQTDCRTEI